MANYRLVRRHGNRSKIIVVVFAFRFPLELHLVHFEQKYRNLTEAVKHEHGVAVIGVLFDVSY